MPPNRGSSDVVTRARPPDRTLPDAHAHPADEWRARAGATLEAVTCHRRFDEGRGLFGRRHLLAGRAYVHLWPFVCAWSAVETATDLPGRIGDRAVVVARALTTGLAAYARAPACVSGGSGPMGFESSVTPPLGRGGEVYYDDNAWAALALLEHFRRHHDPDALTLARRVVAFCCTGWSAESAWSHPGGVRWKVPAANQSRNTCANAPLAEAAALVHAHTGDLDALEWSARIYDWVRGALLGPDDLYLDRIMPDGTRSPERWTYNQGAMIGAGVLLARATGERHYLEEARATAEAALDRYDVAALSRHHGPAFNAVLFRNLFLLDDQVGDARIKTLAAAYGEVAWRSRPHGVRAAGKLPLNAVAPLVELYALLAGGRGHP